MYLRNRLHAELLEHTFYLRFYSAEQANGYHILVPGTFAERQVPPNTLCLIRMVNGPIDFLKLTNQCLHFKNNLIKYKY